MQYILERHKQRCFYSFLPSNVGRSVRPVSDWHCNHQRLPQHKIQLFVDAEHSQEFIFIRCISSVTQSEYSDTEHTSLGTLAKVEVHQRIQIITAVPMRYHDGKARKQTGLYRMQIKRLLPGGKMHMTYFHLPLLSADGAFFDQWTFTSYFLIWLPFYITDKSYSYSVCNCTLNLLSRVSTVNKIGNLAAFKQKIVVV